MAACPHTIAEWVTLCGAAILAILSSLAKAEAFSAGRDACTTILLSALHDGP